MTITDTLYVTERADWRAWLAAHHATAADVWLIYYRKATGRPRIPYDVAVEEALCFGWIDSTVKSLDDERFAQRFSPRRRGSGYSQPNKERLARLIADGRVLPGVLATLGDDVDPTAFEIPADVVAALRAHPPAWDHFQSFAAPYRRIRAAYVDDARDRPEVFEKRLAHLVRQTARGKQFGHGIDAFFGPG